MSLRSSDFLLAADAVQRSHQQVSQEQQLVLYGLYKQATVGDNRPPQPGFLDFKGRAKWNAWKEYAGMSRTEAERRYISLCRDLLLI
jgi:diazepam-binding inhibitor (GABA receptor modulator, acyl-CoA-binding protein)